MNLGHQFIVSLLRESRKVELMDVREFDQLFRIATLQKVDFSTAQRAVLVIENLDHKLAWDGVFVRWRFLMV